MKNRFLALFFLLLFTIQPALSQYISAGGSGGGGGGTGTSNITVSVGATFNGGGVALTAPQTEFAYVPYAGTITAATISADQTGSAVVDVWKVPLGSMPATSANSIAASDLPTLSSQIEHTDTTLTGWTTTVNAGDVIYFHINSTSTVQFLNVTLSVLRSGVYPSISNGTILSNISGSTAAPSGNALSAIAAAVSGGGTTNFLRADGTFAAPPGGGGSGTVTSFSAGNLSPLFTSSVATATTTPALTFSLSNFANNTVLGNVSGS